MRRRDEHGYATIEFIGTLFLAVLVCGGILQAFFIGYAAVSAESVARYAAREASQGMSASAVEVSARNQLRSSLQPDVDVNRGNASESGHEPEVTASGGQGVVTATVSVTVPFLGVGIGIDPLDLQLTRYAVMPVFE